MIPRLGTLLIVLVLALSPLALLVFSKGLRRGEGPWRAVRRIVSLYYLHIAIFFVLREQRDAVDGLNDPLRAVFGDFTWLIHSIEGDLVLQIQQLLENDVLTFVLGVNYLVGYSFLLYFSIILFMYDDDRILAGQTLLNIGVVYLLAVPLYTFFNVQITSYYIPGMKSLLYDSSRLFLDFFSRLDPLDNAFPSLHVGIPFGLLLLLRWESKKRGEDPWRGTYRRFVWFTAIEVVVFSFSILYLGVHWLIDIPAGLLIGYLGAIIVEELNQPLFDALYRPCERALARLRAAAPPVFIGSR